MKTKAKKTKEPMSPKAKKLFEQQERMLADQEFVKPKPKTEVIFRPTFNRHRLRVGDVITLHPEGECIVTRVTDCSAVAYPVRKVELETIDGKEVSFESKMKPIRISSNSQCPILQRLGPDGPQQIFGNNQGIKTGKTMAETKKVHAGTAMQKAAEKRIADQKAKVESPQEIAERVATEADKKLTAPQPAAAQPVKTKVQAAKEKTMKTTKETKTKKTAAAKVDHHKSAKKAWETMRARNAFVEGLLKKKEKAAKIVAGLVEKFDLNSAKAEALVNKILSKAQGSNA